MADKTVRYTAEFKRQMVALARSGRTPASLSREFGVSAMTIGSWIKQDGRDTGQGDGGLSSAEREELQRPRQWAFWRSRQNSILTPRPFLLEGRRRCESVFCERLGPLGLIYTCGPRDYEKTAVRDPC